MAETAVVYLARRAEGPEPVHRFIESYRRHPAGLAHDLVIVWKGFPGPPPIQPVEHWSIFMTDDGFDITAYKLAAEALPHDYLCFLNTFSAIESDDWLSKLFRQASRPEVGIAGATGSFESVRESMKGMSKAVWLCMNGIPYDPLIAAQWGHEIVKHAPNWLDRNPSLYRRARRLARSLLGREAPPNRREIEDNFEAAWEKSGSRYASLPLFPNPHIRSNAFMMRRWHFLEALPRALATKEDCFAFESGHASMTNSIERRGLQAVVVGDDCKVYSQSEWAGSRTFRSGNQGNKLVSDNQTREFDAMSPARKELYERWSWHAPDNPAINLPPQLPDPRAPLAFSPEMFF